LLFENSQIRIYNYTVYVIKIDDVVNAAISRAFNLVDGNIHNDIFTNNMNLKKQMIFADESLTNDEKTCAIRLLTKDYYQYKIIYNKGTRRICENFFVQKLCFVTF